MTAESHFSVISPGSKGVKTENKSELSFLEKLLFRFYDWHLEKNHPVFVTSKHYIYKAIGALP